MTNATDTLTDKIDIEPVGDAEVRAADGGERASLFQPRPYYHHLIRAEAEALCAATFRQICSMVPPPHFKAIYEADQSSWFQSAHQRQRKNNEFDITI